METSSRPAKRARVQPATQPARTPQLELSLYVKWHGESGQSQINRLKLSSLDTVQSLKDLPKQLVDKAYERRALPDHFTSVAYQKYTPQTDCLCVPGSIVRTELRLVVHHEGWEYTVLKRQLGAHEEDRNQTLHVAVVEFVRQTTGNWLGAFGINTPMIAYPVVSLKKDFLEDVEQRLLSDQESFQGSF